MKLKTIFACTFFVLNLSHSSQSIASGAVKTSEDQILKEVELSNKGTFQVKGDAKGQLFFTLIEGQQVKHQVPITGVTMRPLKKGEKSRSEDSLPIVELKKIDSFSSDIQIVSVVISPIQPNSEIAVQANQIEIIKDHHIIHGPSYDSIGMGEGGAYREFDFSKLKKNKQIQILQWLDTGSREQYPNAKILRKETMGGEQYSVVADETYTWNGKGFDKKNNLED